VLTTFLSGFVRSPAMAELYHALWTAWAAVSDGPFMQFGDVGAASKWGAWSIFSALGDQNPRANLLMDLNANSTAWFGNGGGTHYEQGVIKVAGRTGETLAGTAKADFLIGGKGNDVFIASPAKDAISGGPGKDRLVLAAEVDSYTLTAQGDGYLIAGPDTATFLRSVEVFEFKGGVTKSLEELQD